ncbi:hypothetical protein, partial [Streptomyces venezuelae]|uniref:hypothetical protein n=1 Tax=Streptomyces venezuelae TaxID=54571 RepID=UPI001F36577F
KFASEIGGAFEEASRKASIWAKAAADSGQGGVAKIIQRYAEKYAFQAEGLLSDLGNAKANLNALAAEIRTVSRTTSEAIGGGFGRAIGPAFDAYAMMDGAIKWVRTGDSEAFGGAAMGVLLSAGLGMFGAGIATLAGAPLVGVLLAAAAGATIG